VIGGGAAGLVAVETLRQEGFKGRIVLISQEADVPYDRVKLSKQPDLTIDKILLRPLSFYKEHNIELLLNHEVTALDSKTKTISFKNDKPLIYDQVLVASGTRARAVPLSGNHLMNVHTLRVPSDANAIAKLVDDTKNPIKNVVIIGAGFIGLEIAAYLAKKKVPSITVVHMEPYPMQAILGERFSKAWQKDHEEKGIKFINVQPISFEGKEKVEAVKLKNGITLNSELVICGTGVVLNTEFLRSDQEILVGANGSVIVNQFLQSKSGIFAAGDIAEFPYFFSGEHVRIEHWNVAQQQGRIAAKNMLGKKIPFLSVPYFWSTQHTNFRYCGYVRNFDEIIYDGDVEKRTFIAYYVKNNKVCAVASSQRDPAVSIAASLLKLNRMPSVAVLKAGPVDLASFLPK